MPDIKQQLPPLVSVCIIAYNQIKFIEEAIESAVSQDYPSLEVIVADDGSTDGSAELILQYALKYPGIVIPLVEGPNLGITGNCNRALQRCQGKYAVFMGGDDVLLPDKVKLQVDWLETDENRVLCGHRLEVFYDDVNRRPHQLNIRYLTGKGPEWLIKNGCPYGALSIMVRCSSFPKGGFNSKLKYVTDHLFWIECLMSGGEYGYIDAVLGRYRRHSSNITNDVETCLADVQKMFDCLEQTYPQFDKEIILGRVNQVDWPRAISMIRSGRIWRGFLLLLNAFVHAPMLLAVYIKKWTIGLS